MARVTVEDCLKNVKNRFELVIVAAKRARQIMHGKEPKVEWDNDKPTVVALREIAAGFTNINNVNATETHDEFATVEVEIRARPAPVQEAADDDDALDDSEPSAADHPVTPSDEE